MYKPKMEDKRLKISIRNKTTVPLHGLQPNKSIKIDADEHGIPLDKHWRRRLRDSEIDGCIEIENEIKKEKTTKQEDKK